MPCAGAAKIRRDARLLQFTLVFDLRRIRGHPAIAAVKLYFVRSMALCLCGIVVLLAAFIVPLLECFDVWDAPLTFEHDTMLWGSALLLCIGFVLSITKLLRRLCLWLLGSTVLATLVADLLVAMSAPVPAEPVILPPIASLRI